MLRCTVTTEDQPAVPVLKLLGQTISESVKEKMHGKNSSLTDDDNSHEDMRSFFGTISLFTMLKYCICE